MAETILVAGHTFQVPAPIRNKGRRAVAEWLADELTSKQLVPFNPRAVTVEEIRNQVTPETDDEIVEAMRAVEDRVTAREHLASCHSVLAAAEEEDEDEGDGEEEAEASSEEPAAEEGEPAEESTDEEE